MTKSVEVLEHKIRCLEQQLADSDALIERQNQSAIEWAARYDALMDEHVALLKSVGKLPADFEFKD